ncbi:MAG: hypothetical protein PSY12_09160 [bacterium]|nr:hypothetical protein [bacterium]
MQQARMVHFSAMPLAMLFGGTIAPILLMLSPLAVIAARDCGDWTLVARAAKGHGDEPCHRLPLPLM